MKPEHRITCSVCLGTGKGRRKNAGKPCPTCGGVGTIPDRRRALP